jgi:hypothetical protein
MPVDAFNSTKADNLQKSESANIKAYTLYEITESLEHENIS